MHLFLKGDFFFVLFCRKSDDICIGRIDKKMGLDIALHDIFTHVQKNFLKKSLTTLNEFDGFRKLRG